MKLRKRVLSLLLATSMLVSSVQITSFALDDTQAVPQESINDVKVVEETPDASNLQGGVDNSIQEEIPSEDKQEISSDVGKASSPVKGTEDSEATVTSEEAGVNPIMYDTCSMKDGYSEYGMTISNYTDYWRESITEVQVDGKAISTEQYRIVEWDSGISISFNLSAELFVNQTKREQDYEICIKAEGYEDVTGTLELTTYAAQSFTVRLLSAQGNVKKKVTLSMDDIQELIKNTEYRYTIFNGDRIEDYKAVGFTLSQVLEATGISFEPGQTIRFRSNDLHYSNDEIDGSTESYSSSYTYEELMKPRYSFTNLYNNTLVNQISSWMDDSVRTELGQSEKKLVEPIFALKYGYQQLYSFSQTDEFTYNPYTETDRTFTFLMGTAMDDTNSDMVAMDSFTPSSYIFGIDIVKEPEADLCNSSAIMGEDERYSMQFEYVTKDWVQSITGVSIDGQPLEEDSYQIETWFEGSDDEKTMLFLNAALFPRQTNRKMEYKLPVYFK
jgi:hypothetical protein